MKKEKSRPLTARTTFLSVVLFFLFSAFVFAQDTTATATDTTAAAEGASAATVEGDPAAGQELFNTLCTACHRLDSESIGPALRGVTSRRPEEWLHKWIRNSQAVIASGDPYAVALYEEYDQTLMTPFPGLSDAEIDNILAYLGQPKPEPEAAAAQPTAGTASDGGGSGGISLDIVLGILAFVLVLLLAILFLVNKTLRRFATESGIELPEKPKRTPIWKAFAQNQFLVLVSTVFLMLTAAYLAFGWMMQIGVDQGYQPIQPIHFSHRIHAGDNEIMCKYCHSAARKSSVSGIPSLNVCMNCHITITEVAPETATEKYSKEFYDGEIQKLYHAAGWNPAERAYTEEPQPVKWVRIHNLPDFAYFNHSQHVEVGSIQCQTCHGPVQEMEVMYQNAPLTMGWCINCHKETEVKMEGNLYYKKVHEALSKKYGIEEFTVAQMGGIECGKCHY